MPSKIIKNVLAISWISIVVFYYFKIHTYYNQGWDEIWKWMLLILAVPAIYGCYALYTWLEKGEKNLKLTITTPRLIAGLILLILLAGNVTFLVRSPSLYTGEDLFYIQNESGGYLQIINDTSTVPPDGSQLVAAQNSSMEGTSEGFSVWIPQELQGYFILPNFWDIQFGLATKSLGILAILGLILLTTIATGQTILKKLIKNIDDDSVLISIGLGLLTIDIGLFILGALNLLNIYATWALFAVLLATSWKSVFEIFKKIIGFKKTYETKIFNTNLALVLILVLTLVVNFIDNISPLARGWDGMNQYINIAKRIGEAGGLIQMGGNYYWELFMSLGETMFGWTTITLNLADLFPATITAVGLYVVARKFLSKQTSLIVTAFLYLTPMYLFHGVEDNKVDMATFAISIIAFLATYKGLFSENKKEKYTYLAIAGLMAGFAFGIKITSMILILTLLTLILYRELKKTGLFAGIISSVGLLIFTGNCYIKQDLPISDSALGIIGLTFLLTGFITIVIKIFKTKKIKLLTGAIIFIACSLLAFSPWMIKNFSENRSISIQGLTFGVHPQPVIDWQLMETEYGLDKSLCTNTGTNEELNRYLGYQSPVEKYLTLPWHLTMNDQGTSGIYIDFGWIFLALIPGLLIFIHPKKRDEKWLIIIWFTVAYWLFWLLTGNGIIWYGLPGFLGLVILTGGLIENYEKNGKFQKNIITIVVVIFIISSFVFRLGNAGKAVLLLYTSNMLNEETAITAIFPYALEIHDLFEADPDGLIWKIGTSLNYFIEGNFWRTYNDQYIDDLNCLYIERDPALLTERLKALGFEYIIFDYYTYSLSPDPQGTLMTKYSTAWDYLTNYTDIIIPDVYRGHIVAKLK